MKQTQRSLKPTSGQTVWHQKMQRRQRGRSEMNGFLRGFLIVVLLILAAAIGLAGYSAWANLPLVAKINTTVLDYDRTSQIDYTVITRENGFSSQASLGMDQIYLREYVKSIDSTFTFDFTSDRPTQLAWKYELAAEVQVRDAADPSQIILRKVVSLRPEQTGESADGLIHVQQPVRLVLSDYQTIADSFDVPQGLKVTFVLAVRLSIQIDAALPVENLAVSESPALLIPLGQDQFRITREGVGTDTRSIVQPVRYQLVLPAIPFPIYPAAAAFTLLLLIVILVMTKSRRNNPYNRQLNQMLRQARSRLLLIADKAWEPNWCITVSDFSSLVRTAKRLKHPIFCHIDQNAEVMAAYFYVYYGENNYCFTFSDTQPSLTDKDSLDTDLSRAPIKQTQPMTEQASPRPTPRPSRKSNKPDDGKPAEAIPPIPLLPETDDNHEIT